MAKLNRATAAKLSSFQQSGDRSLETGGKPSSSSGLQAPAFRLLHHQSLDVTRHPEKARPTGKKLRPKDRPLANDFVSEVDYDRLLHAWFGNLARVLLPGRAFYLWGGYANCANYPPVLKAHGLYFSQSIVCDKQHPVLTLMDKRGC